MYKIIDIFSASKITAIFSMSLFIVLSFFIFKSKTTGNIYLFYSASLTDLVYYTTANILNSIIVIFMLYYNFYAPQTLVKKHYLYGTVLLLIYLSQFSLTFASIIAASCAFSVILLRLKHQEDHGIVKKTISYLRNLTPFDGILFFTLACWVSATCLDMLGARYAAFPRHEFNFSAALNSFYDLLYTMRRELQLLTLVAVLCAVLLLLYKRRRGKCSHHDAVTCEIIFILCISAIISFSLYIFISAKTDPGYASRISATYGVFIFQILLTVFCIAYLLTEIPCLRSLLPALLCFLFIEITNSQKTWAVPTTLLQRAIVESWIADVRQADADGERTVTITVPKAKWPHPKEWFGEVLGHTLYSHGITSRRLRISLQESDPKP